MYYYIQTTPNGTYFLQIYNDGINNKWLLLPEHGELFLILLHFKIKFSSISPQTTLFVQGNLVLHFLPKSCRSVSSRVSFTGGQTTADKAACRVYISVLLFILKITRKEFSPLNHFPTLENSCTDPMYMPPPQILMLKL